MPPLALPSFTQLPRPLYLRIETIQPGTGFAPHQHDWVQFLYATSGTLSVSLAHGSFTVPTRHALWIPPGVQHQVHAQSTVDFRSLYIAANALEQPDRLRCEVVEVSPLVRELIVAAAALPVEYDEAGRPGRLIKTLLDELQCLQATDIYLPLPGDARLQAICQALAQTPADPRDLDAWAAQAHVSPRTLARLFIKETGLGFLKWRQRLRLYRSLEMMAAGASVTTTALEVGYNSSSAFIAAFKLQFGKAPREFLGMSPGLRQTDESHHGN